MYWAVINVKIDIVEQLLLKVNEWTSIKLIKLMIWEININKKQQIVKTKKKEKIKQFLFSEWKICLGVRIQPSE